MFLCFDFVLILKNFIKTDNWQLYKKKGIFLKYGLEEMKRTSLYINEIVFEFIRNKAESEGVSIARVLKIAVEEFRKNYASTIECSDDSVSYQATGEKWHTFQIVFSDEEYELLIDFRKVWKLSVSFLVTMAFFYYINGEDGEQQRDIHNYVIDSYKIEKHSCEKEIIITIHWKKTEQRPQIEQKDRSSS